MKINFRKKLAFLVALVMVLGSFSIFFQPLQVRASDPVDAVLAVPAASPIAAALPVPASGPVGEVILGFSTGSNTALFAGVGFTELPTLTPTTTSVAITVQADGFVNVMSLVYDMSGLPTATIAAINILVIEGVGTHTPNPLNGSTFIGFDVYDENEFTLQIYAEYGGVSSASLIVNVVPVPNVTPGNNVVVTPPPAPPAETTAVRDTTVTVPVEVEDNHATVELTAEEIEALIENAQDSGVVVLDFTGEAYVDVVYVTIPYALVVAVGEAELHLQVRLNQGTVDFCPIALQGVAYQANGVDLTLSIVQLSPNAFAINLYAGVIAIINVDGTVTITLPFEGITIPAVWMLIGEGEAIPLATINNGDGTVSFVTNQLGTVFFIIEDGLVQLPPSAPAHPFVDVSAEIDHAVQFVYENGLFRGTTLTEFSPERNMTRGMMVTVLWRLAGEPDVSAYANPFADVAAGRYFSDAVVWAAMNGIVLGKNYDEFAPRDYVTVRQAMNILNRYAEQFDLEPMGESDNRDAATRAEIALMLYDFLN
ncbi:MAG: S-layer homology domain-containing protein [Defluviitaleaceae bacterium]|nr:S-layer homology domain-containing protein [Defluviitaleaceae bacterium]